MTDNNLIGTWIRRFLMEHLIGERNLARNTQQSYRDALTLLLPFTAAKSGRPVERLRVLDLSQQIMRLFLLHLERDRGCSISTRNQRLASIRAMARFIGERSPEHISWCAEICSIPLKKTSSPRVLYLDKEEMDALLNAPDRRTPQGFRDYALLLFLYNSGARADEAARLTISALNLDRSPATQLQGKGGKVRCCPLWASTAKVLASLVIGRAPDDRVFLNRRRQPITRYGIHALVRRHALQAARQIPSISTKRVSPHTIRHTTAVHLLRAGVDINTIRAWLGHVSLDTTNIYAEIDLEMKAKALARCEIASAGRLNKPWHQDQNLMGFLRAL